MTDTQIRLLAATGLATIAFLALAGTTGAHRVAADADVAGATLRTGKTCFVNDCTESPRRMASGRGNGRVHAPMPAAERHTGIPQGQ